MKYVYYIRTDGINGFLLETDHAKTNEQISQIRQYFDNFYSGKTFNATLSHSGNFIEQTEKRAKHE